ncbi:hypothetical protein MUK71_01220 [Arthrobacter zhangbolii]|uniref:Uncharacterized protein n=1 Tax=Arthrobacter zhangbolii TaxID=2886936 RepID=A0A9X1SC52_9MICC|nr:hypothetical protein [Arthrobacter zhangbolii]MCC3273494.1 hypothetical protein [Arthrobacter zhangbolii]UON92307.1 hypothetical protein MUK71_01220 [Arthrobacter zhangbolii]
MRNQHLVNVLVLAGMVCILLATFDPLQSIAWVLQIAALLFLAAGVVGAVTRSRNARRRAESGDGTGGAAGGAAGE